MKNLLIAFLLLTGVHFSLQAQYVNIPDANFRNKLIQLGFGSCFNGNALDTTCSLVTGTTLLDVGGAQISDLTGVTYFRNLDSLYCYSNQLTSLPDLPTGLRGLSCGSNQLTVLPTLPSGLNLLSCGLNKLTALPSLPVNLTIFACQNNLITNMPSLPGSVVFLNCSGNQLTTLPTLPSSLITLLCGYNQLSVIPALPSTLKDCFCEHNLLTAIPTLPGNLMTLYCQHNQITSLPSLPATFGRLNCDTNQITTIPALPAIISSLDCRNNLLTTLPGLQNIQHLACDNNPLGSLPSLIGLNSLSFLSCNNIQLSTLPPLPINVNMLYCNHNQLSTVPTLPTLVQTLDCSNNLLTDLPALPTLQFRNLNCSNNPNLLCLPMLPPALQNLNFDNTAITCIPNMPQYLTTSSPAISTLSFCLPGNANGCAFDTNCTGICVWPGDADYSGLVDNNDLLAIGLGYGTTGASRSAQDITWTAHPVADWAGSLTGGTNYKHIDCDGSGSINADDTLAILANYSLVHPRSEGIDPWRSSIPALQIEMLPDTLIDGATVVAHISLGDLNIPASDVYGLAFTFNYDPAVVDTSEFSISFNNNSWLCNNAGDHIDIDKKFLTDGRIETALTRIDHTTRSGGGEIGSVSMKITTGNINGKDLAYYTMNCFISDVTLIDNNGTALQVNTGSDSVQIEFEPTGIADLDFLKAGLELYPNPAKDELNIKSKNTSLDELEVFDLMGQKIAGQSALGAHYTTLNISTLNEGVYVLKIATGKQEFYSRFIRAK